MPHPTVRPLRQALQPMIAGAVLATSHPGLTADSIEIDHVDACTGNDGDDGVGLRVFLYHPVPGVFEQWAEAIGARALGTSRLTSRTGEMSRHVTGRVGATPVEVTCVTAVSEWVWRTSAGRSVHARDSTNEAVARCGRLVVGVADPAHWDLPGYRCTECVHADTGSPQ